MKRLRFLFLALLAIGACDLALARPDRHSHHARTRTHVGVYVGPSVDWSWHFPGPYAYPSYGYGYPSYGYPSYAYPSYGYPSYYSPYAPPVVVVPAAPPSYIERTLPAEGQPAQPVPNDWYYCRKPEGYYPYVRTCPGGWQRVPAQPPQ